MPPKAYPMPDGSKPVFNTIEEARAFKAKNFSSKGGKIPSSGPATPSAPPPSSKPLDIFRDPNVQKQIISNPKIGADLLKVAAGLQSVTGTEPPPPIDPTKAKELESDVLKDFRSLAEGAEMSDYARQMKKKYAIDTGPMMWLKHNLKIPFVPGTDYANIMDLDKEKAFATLNMRMMNPYRKLVTGAQASERELEKFIAPALPQISDNDKTWEAKNNLNKAVAVYNMRLMFGMQKAQGKDVSAMEEAIANTRMPGMDGNPMAEEDDKWTSWSLGKLNDSSAQPQERKMAMEILRTNNIDPAWIKSLPSMAKEHPEWFKDSERERVEQDIGDAELRNARKILGQ